MVSIVKRILNNLYGATTSFMTSLRTKARDRSDLMVSACLLEIVSHYHIPHEYVELATPVNARYIKLENIHVPSGKFAISGFRVFGNGQGTKPKPVKDFMVLRTEKDKRSAWIKWGPVGEAYAYIIQACTRTNCTTASWYTQPMNITTKQWIAKTLIISA